LKVYYFFD